VEVNVTPRNPAVSIRVDLEKILAQKFQIAVQDYSSLNARKQELGAGRDGERLSRWLLRQNRGCACKRYPDQTSKMENARLPK
jgi:hypothetical protein